MLQIDPKNIIPVTEARANFKKLIAQTKKDKVSLLTKQGKPALVVLDPSFFSLLRERWQRLSDVKKFDEFLDDSRRAFGNYLKKKRYDPDKISEKKVNQILANP